MKKVVVSLLALLCCHHVMASTEQTLNVQGRWIKDTNGKVMVDPQTSGLTSWHHHLITLSDRSAIPSQQLKLHQLDPISAEVMPQHFPMVLADDLKSSCFAHYVTAHPDLESVVADPDQDNVFYVITEDGSSYPLQGDCAKEWQDSGATKFPRLLLRLELQTNNQALITHIRPIKFDRAFKVGNFPNDGIEGLTMDNHRHLYLAVEKDQQTHPRLFMLTMDKMFWQSSGFAAVQQPNVQLPPVPKGAHPMNALQYVPADHPDHPGYLLAMARNDNQLWVLDLSGKHAAKVIPIQFWAQVENPPASCQDWEKMPIPAIEGITVQNNTVWFVNDPWKSQYLKNLKCPVNAQNYSKFAPLLFSTPLQKSWFQ